MKLLTLAAVLLLLFSASAFPQVDTIVSISAVPQLEIEEQTRRELAFLKRFDNYDEHGLRRFFTSDELVQERTNDGMAERLDDRVEYILVQKKVADQPTIHAAILKARESGATFTIDEAADEAMVGSLRDTLNSAELYGSDLENIIAHAASEAKGQLRMENEELAEELMFYDESDTLDKILETLLSKRKACNTEKFRSALIKAFAKQYDDEPAERTLLLYQNGLKLRTKAKPVKQQTIDLPPSYQHRYLIKEAIEMARKQVLKKRKKLDFDLDKEMVACLLDILKSNPRFKKAVLQEAVLQKAMLKARRTLRLVNAYRTQKLLGFRSLLDNDGSFAEYPFQELIKEAAYNNKMEYVASMLQFTQFQKDFDVALLAAAEIRCIKHPEWTDEEKEKNLELITLLLKDQRASSSVVRKAMKVTRRCRYIDKPLLEILNKHRKQNTPSIFWGLLH